MSRARGRRLRPFIPTATDRCCIGLSGFLLKLANLKKEELIVRLVEFLRNQFSSYDKKVKSLKQKLAELETKLENLFLFPLSLKLIMFIFVLLREIINKRIILLG